MESMIDIFWELLTNNSGTAWIAFAVSFGVVLAILLGLRKLLVRYFTRLAERTTTRIDDVLAQSLGRTKFIFLLLIALWFACRSLYLPVPLAKTLNVFVLLALFFQIGLWLNTILAYIVEHFVRLEIEEESSRLATSTALTFLGRLVLWSVLLLVALENLGVDVTSLVTGLGVDGTPRRTYLYQVVDNEWTMREYGHQAVVWQTAVHPVVALEMLVLRVLSAEKSGKNSLDIAGLLKIRGSEIQQRYSELMMLAAGPYSLPLIQEAMEAGWQGDAAAGALGGFPGGVVANAPLASTYFNMRKTTIYGGSNEVQRTIVSQVVLG